MLVLERASTSGFEASSRNNEVIHGGLYYKAGSLKARCCVVGRERLYLYCREHGILHAQIGKRIVATREGEIAGIDRIAKMAQANGVNDFPPAYFCPGVHFALADRAPFRHLVYPVPPSGGLGVHVTLDLAGRARFGPDVEWVPAVDYTVDPTRADAFNAAVRTYWPELRSGALQPGYAGIGPKASGPKEPAVDFVVQGPEIHGVPGLVNLYGIESPDLTGFMPLAEQVLRRLTPAAAE